MHDGSFDAHEQMTVSDEALTMVSHWALTAGWMGALHIHQQLFTTYYLTNIMFMVSFEGTVVLEHEHIFLEQGLKPKI